jgi:hypothetical protein
MISAAGEEFRHGIWRLEDLAAMELMGLLSLNFK